MLRSMRNAGHAGWCILGVGVLTLVGLRGCAKPVAMLHQRPSFDGKITVEGDSLSLSGELVFQRKSQHCQLTRRQPTHLVLGRDPEGNLFAFEADRHRPLQAEETRELRAVLALVDGTELSEPQVGEAGYWVQVPGLGRLRVTLHESPAGVHGQHR